MLSEKKDIEAVLGGSAGGQLIYSKPSPIQDLENADGGLSEVGAWLYAG